jgi:hypothetical protein
MTINVTNSIPLIEKQAHIPNTFEWSNTSFFKTKNKPNSKSNSLQIKQNQQPKPPSIEENQKQKIQANHQTHQLHKQTCKTTTKIKI